MSIVTNSEIIDSNQIKTLTQTSFGMDINILKAPMFLYGNFKEVKGRQIEEKTFFWIDSKGFNRKLYMYCKNRLPRQFESDVYFGLLGIFIKKNTPFPYDNERKLYIINTNKVEFSWYELAMFMRIPCTGYYIEKMKEAVRILKQTQYFSYENGVLYDKKKGRYIQSGEEGISLLTKYKFKSVKKVLNDEYSDQIDSNFVLFDDMIIDNLRHEYYKFLNIDLYFSIIPSGIERGLYGYLEANRYNEQGQCVKFIKRKFETLKYSIPIEFNYPSEVKRRLKKPLNHFKEIGYLKDYVYGDDLKLDGKKEDCIYFLYDITVKELKQILSRKTIEQLRMDLNIKNIEDDIEEENNVSKSENKSKPYLFIPNDLREFLLNEFKYNPKNLPELMAKYDKWTILKYILWVEKQVYDGNTVKSKSGLLNVGINGQYDVEEKAPEVVEFIEINKANESKNKYTVEENNRKLYEEYINNQIELFKEEEKDVYNILYDNLINDIDKNIDKKIKELTLLNSPEVDKFKEYKEKGIESQMFIETLRKEIRLYKQLPTFEEFIMNNK